MAHGAQLVAPKRSSLLRSRWLSRENPPRRCRCSSSCSRGSGGAREYTIWLFNIAMENGPFIDGLPIINGDFPWLC